jgi:hypothetical protein
MRDMMAQIRDVGDGIRGGTYTMTAPVITGGSVTGVTALATSGNLTFTGTGNRILGDFSNATIANQVAFQTSTTNGNTIVGVIPNGTSIFSGFRAFNNSNPTNAGYLDITISDVQARLRAGITGTGTFLPLTFATNNAERMRIDSSGIVTMSAYGAGAATFSAAGVISSVSDETWKIKDGVPFNPEAMLQKLEAGYWFYNEEKAPIFGSDRQLGFYAQNVHEAIGEEAAPTPEEGKPWGYYDRSVLAITVMSLKNALNSIQELKTELDSVKAELQTLKGS